MNIKEFRNNFCKLAETTESITITKHNRIIGVYTPYKIEICERDKFNKDKCFNTATSTVEIKGMKFKVCGLCLNRLKEEVDVEVY